MPLFSKWNKNMLKLLYLNAFKETYKKGDYIFQEGSPAEAVYISCSGEFTVGDTLTHKTNNLFTTFALFSKILMMFF